jgi:hypothetical protein
MRRSTNRLTSTARLSAAVLHLRVKRPLLITLALIWLSCSAVAARAAPPSPSPTPAPAASGAPSPAGGDVDIRGLRAALAAPKTAGSGGVWTDQFPSTAPGEREGAAMAYDAAHGVVVLFGGFGCSSPGCSPSARASLNDSWIWGGSSWIPQSPPGSLPPPRSDAGMAYDSAIGRVVLFGGSTGNGSLGDTWVWDGAAWTAICGTTVAGATSLCGPSARAFPALAYYPPSGNVLLFGGLAGGAAGDMWSFDGSRWTQQCTTSPCLSTLPPARFAGALAYHEPTQTLVLFGGGSASPDLGDTWTWNGSIWAQQHPLVSPSGRAAAGLTYDENTSTDVLFAGLEGASDAGDSNETWTWNGSTWANVTPPLSPPAREPIGPVYDAAMGQVVTFGGVGRTDIPLGDTWSWDGPPLPIVTGVTPNGGPTAGGTPVTVSGAGIRTDSNAVEVYFGATPAYDVICQSTTQCSAVSPAGSGTVDVVLISGGQPSLVSGGDRFTYGLSVAAGLSSVTAGPPAVPADGTSFSVLTVIVRDTSGNPIGGDTVVLTPTSGSSAVQPIDARTDTNGVAIFATKDGTTETITYSATDASAGVQLAQTASVAYRPQGDVNLNGVVESVDALCVLRMVAQLPATAACPESGSNWSAADVNRSGKVDSVDALCTLRLVAKLSVTQACPAFTAASAGSPVASRVEPAANPGGVALSLHPLPPAPGAGRQSSLTLTADTDGAALGAWTVDLSYDPVTVTVLGCQATVGGICNAAFAPGVVRVSGASAAGLDGSQVLTTLTLRAKGAPTEKLFTVTPITLTDSAGAPVGSGR